MYIKARVSLLCTYDSDADAAYIYLEHPVPPAAAERVIPFDIKDGMFNLDLDTEGHVLGLEILGARKRLPHALLGVMLDQNQEQTEQS
ncbi:uncharacterized protein YuzE [Hamadaea flava]|uniref:DUF2283 domain-containing protein n=1 Tax=Hamadaea flava TaxID=1742688 RepID=A0ABV8LRV8_9ACTN|nr:DUF2283 domain-containing protein [Hamadaea flava]MCP2327297.1 uncharacterized protein YuzE [Hamadaea flava]